MRKIRICFDVDGTIADLYAVDGWLEMLTQHIVTPYATATPLLHLSTFARIVNKLQRQGHELVVISWLARNSTAEYDKEVTAAKEKWLRKHLPSVHWDEVHIIPYGTPKQNYCRSASDILFDDEENNRLAWTGTAYAETAIFEVLKNVVV